MAVKAAWSNQLGLCCRGARQKRGWLVKRGGGKGCRAGGVGAGGSSCGKTPAIVEVAGKGETGYQATAARRGREENKQRRLLKSSENVRRRIERAAPHSGGGARTTRPARQGSPRRGSKTRVRKDACNKAVVLSLCELLRGKRCVWKGRSPVVRSSSSSRQKTHMRLLVCGARQQQRVPGAL
jgi:hypothetical protein